MLTPEALSWLRCPLDPKRETSLRDDEIHLVCTQCQVKFRIHEGIANLIADEAELPKGCSNKKQLPCQKKEV